MNEIIALMKSSIGNTVLRTVNCSVENFSPPAASLIRGLRKALVSPFTTPANAAPITTPTAISTTFPRRMNFLKPSSIPITSNSNCGQCKAEKKEGQAQRPSKSELQPRSGGRMQPTAQAVGREEVRDQP